MIGNFEIIIAKGKTIEELQEDANRYVKIHDGEIKSLVGGGVDTISIHVRNWFMPMGAISFCDGYYLMPMLRARP